jgi:hypothetical protein
MKMWCEFSGQPSQSGGKRNDIDHETSACGSLDGICISCEVPSIADTTLGISDQYHFFCHQTGMVDHWIHITFS